MTRTVDQFRWITGALATRKFKRGTTFDVYVGGHSVDRGLKQTEALLRVIQLDQRGTGEDTIEVIAFRGTESIHL
jgi:hypothetical protein